MSKKNKVIAPRTYNPGKGRPKEYLAYLNWQEMQELQRINGGNMERGPKGLPSFPPAGAMSGGSAKSPASTSTAKAAGSKPTGSTTQKGTTNTKMGSNTTKSPGAASKPGGSSLGGGNKNSSGGFSQSQFGGSGKTGPVGMGTGGGGAGRDSTRGLGVGAGTTAIGRSDKTAINAANKANTRSAENTPALRSDRARSTGPGGGEMQAPVRDTSPGQRISGAIRSIQQPAAAPPRGVGVPARTVTPTSPGAGGGFGYADSLQKSLTRGSLTTPVGPTSGVTAPKDRYGDLSERVRQMALSDAYRSPSVPTAPRAPEKIQDRLQATVDPNTWAGFEADKQRRLAQAIREDMASDVVRGYDPLGSIRPSGIAQISPSQAPPQRLSDAGIRKSIPGFAPRGPAVVAGGEGYVNPAGVPESVRKALDAAGFNPDGTRKAVADPYSRDDGMRAPVGPSITGRRVDLPSMPVPADPSLRGRLEAMDGINPYVKNDMARIAGLGSERLAQAVESFGDYARGLYNNTVSGLAEDIGGMFPSGPPAGGLSGLFSGGYRTPGQVMSGPNGLSIVNPDGSTSPYPSAPRPSTPMASQGVSYATPAEAEAANTTIRANIAEREASLQPGLPSPSGEESISGVRAIPTPDSIGMLPDGYRAPAPPKQVTVKSGDSLTKIARDNDTTVDSLLDANPQITNPDRIREGQKINVPTSGAPGEGDGEVGSYGLPSQQLGPPSQDITIEKEAEIAQENFREKADIARRIGVPALNLAVPGAGTLFGQGLKYLNESTQKLVDAYQDAGMAERKEMEDAFPNLIAHGNAMGINTYYGMDKYKSWADERGLRAPPSREGGGGERGIASLLPSGGGISRPVDTEPRPPSSSTPSGSRPYIYYEWDLGLNIPSPSDPKYTDYQKYLSERAAAQASFGMV